MQRRHFVQSISAFAGIAPFLPLASLSSYPPDELLAIFIRGNDTIVETILPRQQTNADQPFFGGFPNADQIYNPGSTATYIRYLLGAYLLKDSNYYQSEVVAQALERAIGFLEEMQYEDGTIDLLSTNFHSTPDTAFAVEHLAMSLGCLRQLAPDALPDFKKRLEAFLINTGKALSVGGIHTPNHRWVVCMALARLNALLPNPAYTARIDEWLQEGIDIDPDGQYTEQSTAVYTPLTNRCLITIARLTNKPELYEQVRRNLRMTLYYVHANGEIVTEASNRQDQFQIAKMANYYYPYRYMALLDKDPVFSAMAFQVEESVTRERLANQLMLFLEDPGLLQALPTAGPLPTDYVRHFPHSNLARIRRGRVDATILADNYNFFTFFNGQAALQAVRFASAFFGKGQFRADTLRIEDGEYVLEQYLTGPYYQPFPTEALPDDGDWEKMPRSLRPQSEVQELTSTVRIREEQGQFTIRISITGTERVPVAVELAFRPGGQFKGVTPVESTPSAYLLSDDSGIYTVGTDQIRFGPGRVAHQWTQLRGALPKLNGECVYLTGYTPLEWELMVEAER